MIVIVCKGEITQEIIEFTKYNEINFIEWNEKNLQQVVMFGVELIHEKKIELVIPKRKPKPRLFESSISEDDIFDSLK